MIAVDTNILVYCHRKDSPFYSKASEKLQELASSGERWVIPWACLYEFLSITTHPRIYSPPSSLNEAINQVEAWLECPTLELISESQTDQWPVLRDTLKASHVTGPRIHDARIAAVCKAHGVNILWSCDRDFSRFQEIKTLNPLI
ncbi:PIN domain-containing protein [bacterium]|nr:PIN domain-containing protein [bacterium]